MSARIVRTGELVVGEETVAAEEVGGSNRSWWQGKKEVVATEGELMVVAQRRSPSPAWKLKLHGSQAPDRGRASQRLPSCPTFSRERTVT